MKSIVEEASSISKAIEKGWVKAGSPKEFSVKIYEDAEKNFFGITTKPAKIGIFFEEGRERRYSESSQYQQKGQYQKTGPQTKQQQQPKHVAPKPKFEKTEKLEPKKHVDSQFSKQNKQELKTEHKQTSVNHEHKVHQTKQPHHGQQVQAQSERYKSKDEPVQIAEAAPETHNKQLWTPEMNEAAANWLNNLLSQTGYSNVKFSINADKYYLKINFDAPICKDLMKERQLFAGISLLLMQTIKKKFKNPFKGYKVILMRNEQAS